MNTSFRAAPWADVLYGMDLAWWDAYQSEVQSVFKGLCVNPWRKRPHSEFVKFDHQRNSGAGAVALAAHWGSRNIVMLGYDAKKTDGRAHWHADHPGKLGNAGSVGQWPGIFTQLAHKLRGMIVRNASRVTAIDAFPRVSLEDALSEPMAAKPKLPTVVINGMHGLGDNLHQRAVVRSLMRDHDVWLETPWPSAYHDLVGERLHLIGRGSTLRTQAKNAAREAALYQDGPVPTGRVVSVKYPPAGVRKHRGVLPAMCASSGVGVEDFRMPVPPAWQHGLDLPADRPVLVVRPLVERSEWGGCKNRNPDVTAWLTLFRKTRPGYFVVSVADLVPRKEWLVHEDLQADLTLHAGELDFRALAALWRDAEMVITAPGFGLVLAQAVGTPVVAVFGGYESAYSFSAGATHTPTLAIEPARPCDCFSHTHRCDKRIDMVAASRRLEEFMNEHCKERCAAPALC